jgi:hypothetical protein
MTRADVVSLDIGLGVSLDIGLGVRLDIGLLGAD